MAKKSRKANSSLFSWPKILLVIIPVFAAVLIMFNSSNGRSVLGVSDSSLLNLNREKLSTSSGTKCRQNKVSSFSVSGLCDANRNGFKQVNYTCADGTKGSLVKDCVNIQAAFERAIKACSKNNKCERIKPSDFPKERSEKIIPSTTPK